ncbi:MAG: DEAD/DEAH box helicase [Chloroflexi bacterium]|nr:DEAD/DEAH box helicase [Chloroflexota bacterium]
MTFADLGIQRTPAALLAKQGITVPTPIQEQAIPAMLNGRDVVGQARTGSGKTLAFALPILDLCDRRRPGVQALVLVPTRELALQVGDVIEKLAPNAGLRMTLLYGGHSATPERQALARGPQIVVGTPGRVIDHLQQRNLSLRDLRMLVLDEADEMLDRGFAPDVERIISQAPTNRQTALFSATVPSWVASTAARYLIDPVTVRVDVELESPPEIDHLVYEVEAGAKLDTLMGLLDRRSDGPVLVFGRTKYGVARLARQLDRLGYPVSALQGDMGQHAREAVMAGFRSGELPILVATNVAARGLDVEGISQVINYELPETPELFTHRVGRTGRMGRKGEAITLVTPEDAPKMRLIERTLGRRLPRFGKPAGDVTPGDSARTAAAATHRSTARRPEPAARPQPTLPVPARSGFRRRGPSMALGAALSR